MSVEDLKKALCQKMKEATKERLEAKRPLQANYWLGYAEGLEKALDLFSVFQKDYDKQVHVPRQQLEDIYNDILAKPHSVRLRLQELLEASGVCDLGRKG